MRRQQNNYWKIMTALLGVVITFATLPEISFAGFIAEEADTVDNLGPGENELNVGEFIFSDFHLNATASVGLIPISEGSIQVIARLLDTPGEQEATLDFGLSGFGAFLPNESLDAKLTFKITAPDGYYFSRVAISLSGGTASGTGIAHISESVLDDAPISLGGNGNFIANFDVIMGDAFDLSEATNGEDLDEELTMIWVTKDIAAIARSDGRAAITGFEQLYQTEQVPEPSTMVLGILSLIGMLVIRRYRK